MDPVKCQRFPPAVYLKILKFQKKPIAATRDEDMDRDTPSRKSPDPDVTPDAGTEGPSPGPGLGLGPGSRKRAARRSSPDENASRDPVQKRRRRAFSCLSCQRLKCRCEYDPGAQGCHRCQTLRCVFILGQGLRPALYRAIRSDRGANICLSGLHALFGDKMMHRRFLAPRKLTAQALRRGMTAISTCHGCSSTS